MIYRWYVKDALLFKDCTDILIQGQNKSCIFGSDKFTSGILAIKLNARPIELLLTLEEFLDNKDNLMGALQMR